jgi:SAM-dependent methyltransferase
LQTQTDVNWDWTIWFRDARTDIPTDLTRDPRVVVKTEQQTTIAALKKKAYASAAGEYLVGLDAGDEFADNAIAAIRDASERPAAIYSDFAICRKNGSSVVYPSQFGWENYQVQRKEHTFNATRAFDPTAAAMVSIPFSPFRLSAWHRDVYQQVGGHDANMAAAEDYDLWCRTFQHEAMFPIRRLGECLYFKNIESLTPSPQAINDETKYANDTRTAYFSKLLQADARRRNLALWSVDQDAEGLRTVPLNLRQMEAEDSSVGLIACTNRLSYLEPRMLKNWMREAYRVLAPGGWLSITNPSTDSRAGFQDPMYTTFVNENTWLYFTDSAFAQQSFESDYPVRFQAVRLWTVYPEPWYKQKHMSYVRADLCALKGQRQPGQVRI